MFSSSTTFLTASARAVSGAAGAGGVTSTPAGITCPVGVTSIPGSSLSVGCGTRGARRLGGSATDVSVTGVAVCCSVVF